jgi:hypothetical protein
VAKGSEQNVAHADNAITARHYLNQKERVNFDMGSLLAMPENVVPMPQSAGTTARALRKLSSRYRKFEKCSERLCEVDIPLAPSLLAFRRQQILLGYGRAPSDDRQIDTIRRGLSRAAMTQAPRRRCQRQRP